VVFVKRQPSVETPAQLRVAQRGGEWENDVMTPEHAETIQREMWRRLSLEDRFRIVAAMIEDGFNLVAVSIRAEHPEYGPEEVRTALRKRIYDD